MPRQQGCPVHCGGQAHEAFAEMRLELSQLICPIFAFDDANGRLSIGVEKGQITREKWEEGRGDLTCQMKDAAKRFFHAISLDLSSVDYSAEFRSAPQPIARLECPQNLVRGACTEQDCLGRAGNFFDRSTGNEGLMHLA